MCVRQLLSSAACCIVEDFNFGLTACGAAGRFQLIQSIRGTCRASGLQGIQMPAMIKVWRANEQAVYSEDLSPHSTNVLPPCLELCIRAHLRTCHEHWIRACVCV